MSDSLPDADSGRYARTPRWVKVSAVIALVLVVLVAVMLLLGGGAGGHGPGRHVPSGDADGRTTPVRSDAPPAEDHAARAGAHAP